ncbi:ComF family protein [Corynebacterium poyangense]|uniref:ComF family protein n=1 Tax=Corynebacterium poyangense TaxID=2684405 RepID=A0A7H0SMJ3_9CORY|nr:ComF family protein [Corynebacterium poyangense]QNQ89768.1 ComF family protein [Corynebacterium poyangense]
MELFVPRWCAGCRQPGSVLCADCQEQLRRIPQRITPRVDPHCPVFSLSPWNGPHREIVLDMKERANRAIRPYAGAVIGSAISYLQARGELPHRLTLVPAPTLPKNARRRGGDHITDICRFSGFPTKVALRHSGVQDSVGLSASQRRTNLSGGIRVYPCLAEISTEVVLVDDVVTTGATLAASTEVLVSGGVRVRAALTLAFA